MNILMADDDVELLKLAATIVRGAVHKPIMAFDGIQVLPTAMREKPDLILLDINMPGGAGSDHLARLKRRTLTSGIPVVVISGSQKAETPDLVKTLGAEGYVAKPWLPETFVGQLQAKVPSLAW